MSKPFRYNLDKCCPAGCEFIFRTPSGTEVARAKNLREFFKAVGTAPLSSVLYHANGNHFSSWMSMMGEKDLAKQVSQLRGQTEVVRKSLLQLVR